MYLICYLYYFISLIINKFIRLFFRILIFYFYKNVNRYLNYGNTKKTDKLSDSLRDAAIQLHINAQSTSGLLHLTNIKLINNVSIQHRGLQMICLRAFVLWGRLRTSKHDDVHRKPFVERHEFRCRLINCRYSN